MERDKKRRILFVTERRTDYSRLKPIMEAAQKSDKLEPRLLLTGMHLLKSFGETKKTVEADGFKINATLPIFNEKDSDDGSSMVKGLGRALLGMADIFKKIKPDILFAGFDIGANFAAAITAMHLNIHVAHLEGGERSGTIDEVIRHAMTKFAHIHFACSAESAKRIAMLGEDKRYIFNVGVPSIETIGKIKYPNKKEICDKYGLAADKKLIILLQHSVTTEANQAERQIFQSIEAVKLAGGRFNSQALAIYSNNDAGGRRIVGKLKESGVKITSHIAHDDFLRLMKAADVLVGNSSAAIHEAPSLGLPAVNIGTRQQFRERGDNIIDAGYDKAEIIKAIRRSLFDKAFLKKVGRRRNPYYQPNSAGKVVKILETIKLPPIQKVICY